MDPAETQDQTETHDQPKIPAEIPAEITTEAKKERIKNPKRVEQGKKLAEWNKANKKRLSRRQLETPPLQLETPQLEDKTSQLEVEDKTSQLEVEDKTSQLEVEASQPQLTTTKLTTKLTTKKTNTKSKDYFLIAETILIISLVGAGLFFYTTTTQKCSNKAQLKAGKAQLETATKKATDANIATNKSNEDDYFEM